MTESDLVFGILKFIKKVSQFEQPKRGLLFLFFVEKFCSERMWAPPKKLKTSSSLISVDPFILTSTRIRVSSFRPYIY